MHLVIVNSYFFFFHFYISLNSNINHKTDYYPWSSQTMYHMKRNIRFIMFPVLGTIFLILPLLYENYLLINNIWIYQYPSFYFYIIKFLHLTVIIFFLSFTKDYLSFIIYVFYLATKFLISQYVDWENVFLNFFCYY